MYKVLVIEDDHALRQILGKLLSTEGYESLTCHNAAAGLEACSRHKPDLILLDVHLPDGNGLQICRRLKSDERLRHIPIIILTGEGNSIENRVEGLDSGADDYVLKPFEPVELLARVRRVLEASLKPRSTTR